MALTDKLTAIANAIRGKTGGTEKLTLDQMAAEIAGIETGGGIDALIDGSVTAVTSNVSTVRAYALRGLSNLASANFPFATSVSTYAFSGCSSLVNLNFPMLQTIGERAFTDIGAVEKLSLPNVTNIGHYAFIGAKVKSFDFPIWTNSAKKTQIFENTSAQIFDFGAITYFQFAFFRGSQNLRTLIIRTPSVCALTATNAFESTPFASGGSGGTVYVPSALIESYQAATNWSTLYAAGTCNFVAIEGSEYE